MKLTQPNSYFLGTYLGTDREFFLPDEDREHHTLIVGGTGGGKSKCVEQLCRGLLSSGQGFGVIDPHGDLSEDALAYIDWYAAVKDPSILQRVHYLEPSYESVFAYAPFRFRPACAIPEAFHEAAYESWLHTKVDRVSEIIQRKQNQLGFEGMPRLQRMLRNVLYATGRAVDRSGTHLPLADALVLLDVQHPRHGEVFARVAPFLDREIVSDFEVLHGFKRLEDFRRETESTVNRLRSLLGPIVRAIFSETVNTIDFYSIIQNGGILLVNLRETDYFSADQAGAIGGLFIHEILTTAASTPRQERTRFSLIIDEVGRFIGEDLLRGLGEVRKYKLDLTLCGQDLSTFIKGMVDLRPKVLSQCGTVITFNQANHEDLEVLADRVCRGTLDFEEQFEVKDRPDGYDLLPMQDYSESFTWNDGWSEGGSANRSETKGTTLSQQQTLTKNWSRGSTKQEGVNESDSAGSSKSNSSTTSRADAPILRGASQIGTRTTPTAGASSAIAETSSRATGRQSSLAESQNEGEAVANARSVAENTNTAEGESVDWHHSGSQGGSSSVTHRTQIIQRTREEWHPTGRLRRQISDQLEMIMTAIYSLHRGQCVVKLRSQTRAIALQVAFVAEKYRDEAVKFARIDAVKKEVQGLQPYFIVPRLGLEAQEERLVRYLGADVPRLPAAALAAAPEEEIEPIEIADNPHGY